MWVCFIEFISPSLVIRAFGYDVSDKIVGIWCIFCPLQGPLCVSLIFDRCYELHERKVWWLQLSLCPNGEAVAILCMWVLMDMVSSPWAPHLLLQYYCCCHWAASIVMNDLFFGWSSLFSKPPCALCWQGPRIKPMVRILVCHFLYYALSAWWVGMYAHFIRAVYIIKMSWLGDTWYVLCLCRQYWRHLMRENCLEKSSVSRGGARTTHLKLIHGWFRACLTVCDLVKSCSKRGGD